MALTYLKQFTNITCNGFTYNLLSTCNENPSCLLQSSSFLDSDFWVEDDDDFLPWSWRTLDFLQLFNFIHTKQHSKMSNQELFFFPSCPSHKPPISFFFVLGELPTSDFERMKNEIRKMCFLHKYFLIYMTKEIT